LLPPMPIPPLAQASTAFFVASFNSSIVFGASTCLDMIPGTVTYLNKVLTNLISCLHLTFLKYTCP
jgi:hypothetical protein